MQGAPQNLGSVGPTGSGRTPQDAVLACHAVVVCGDIGSFVPIGGDRPYIPELMLSMAAAVIEVGGDPADVVEVTTRAFLGLLVYYQAVLAAEPGAREPLLDRMLVAAQDGSLRGMLAGMVAGCDARGMGVHFAR